MFLGTLLRHSWSSKCNLTRKKPFDLLHYMNRIRLQMWFVQNKDSQLDIKSVDQVKRVTSLSSYIHDNPRTNDVCSFTFAQISSAGRKYVTYLFVIMNY